MCLYPPQLRSIVLFVVLVLVEQFFQDTFAFDDIQFCHFILKQCFVVAVLCIREGCFCVEQVCQAGETKFVVILGRIVHFVGQVYVLLLGVDSRQVSTDLQFGVTFRARLPSQGGCEPDDVTVYRLWKAGGSVTASRHRYVVDPALAKGMQADGWVLEGAVFCAPAS